MRRCRQRVRRGWCTRKLCEPCLDRTAALYSGSETAARGVAVGMPTGRIALRLGRADCTRRFRVDHRRSTVAKRSSSTIAHPRRRQQRRRRGAPGADSAAADGHVAPRRAQAAVADYRPLARSGQLLCELAPVQRPQAHGRSREGAAARRMRADACARVRIGLRSMRRCVRSCR